MTIARRGLLAVALAVAATRRARAQDLLARLRGGGGVMLIRHAPTVPGTGDPPGFRLDDCRTQRNLGEPGRARARAWGALLRREGVAVEALRGWIRSWRGPGVAVLVTHQVNITALTGVIPRAGEAVVLAPPDAAVLGRLPAPSG